MKKQLIAGAVAAAFAMPALAQNVRIYGIMDASLGKVDNGTVENVMQTSSAMTSSRLGLDGSEDLGGGLKAFFKLESRLGFDNMGSLGTSAVTSGGASSTSSAGGVGVFNRDAFIGLSGGFGTIRLGTQATTVNKMGAAINATGNNNGDNGAAFGSSFNVLADRVANSYSFEREILPGLTAEIGGFSGEYINSTATLATSASGYSGHMASLLYKSGPLTAAVGFADRNGQVNGLNGARQQEMTYGVRYNFGVADVGISRNEIDPALKISSQGKDDRSVTTLTVNAPLGDGLTVFGAFSNLKEEAAGTTFSSDATVKGDASMMTFGVVKELSKRTNIYAFYNTVDNNASSKFTNNSGASPALGQDVTWIAAGVRHSF